MKFIIQIEDGFTPESALWYCMRVMEGELVSVTARGPQHCFLTKFEDGTLASVKKNRSGSETFKVWKPSAAQETSRTPTTSSGASPTSASDA